MEEKEEILFLKKRIADLEAEEIKRQQAEQLVEDAREYAESIVTTVRQPLIILDAELKVISANKAFYQTFKIDPEKTMSRFIYDMGDQQWNIPKLRQLLEELLPRDNVIDNYMIDDAFKGVGPKTLLLNARRLIQKTSKTLLILLAVEDITERRRAEKALEEVEKMRDDLTDLIVHDLKNPLSGIVSTNDMLLEGLLGPLTEEQKKYLGYSKAGAKKLLNLIMDLLETRKLEENQMTLNRTAFRPDELAKELGWLDLLADQEKKTLETRIDKDVSISADRNLIVRVIENLVSNAIKHTSAGGKITLLVTRYSPQEILFEVTDTGEGIPKEYLDKLFNRFFKVETQTKKTRIDTGLGLYFCKMAVEAHGGRIGVESTVGQGSRFYFYLPGEAS